MKKRGSLGRDAKHAAIESRKALVALHGLSGELGGEDTEALLDSNAVSGELVVGGESCRMSRLGEHAFDRLLLERVDALAVLFPPTRIKR